MLRSHSKVVKVKVSCVEQEPYQLGLALDVEVGQLDLRHPEQEHHGVLQAEDQGDETGTLLCLTVCTL